MIRIETVAEFRGVSIPNPQLATMAKYFDAEHDAFVKGAALVHRKTVFQILTRIIRLCNVDTGRLRGSFTPLMDKWGFKGYEAYMKQAPIIGAPPKTKGKGYSETEVNKGKVLGQFIDAVLNTTITSNVAYASDVNFKSYFLSAALIWGDNQYKRNFENYFKAAAKRGWIPEQNPNEEGEA
jgi:hypothetical protein